MRRYCPVCDREQETGIEEREETYPVRGVDITIRAQVCVCKACNEDLFDMELDEQNLEKAYDLYRKQKNLLSPQQIRAIRQQYGLTQVNFARLLGMGDKTITRYENGCLPDEAQSNLIMLAADRANFEKLRSRQQKKQVIDIGCWRPMGTYSQNFRYDIASFETWTDESAEDIDATA